MDVQASLFIKISKLHHFNPLMETEQDHLTHARKTQSRAELSVVSDDQLQREKERESFISFQTMQRPLRSTQQRPVAATTKQPEIRDYRCLGDKYKLLYLYLRERDQNQKRVMRVLIRSREIRKGRRIVEQKEEVRKKEVVQKKNIKKQQL